jgi:hypothetical protein
VTVAAETEPRPAHVEIAVVVSALLLKAAPAKAADRRK